MTSNESEQREPDEPHLIGSPAPAGPSNRSVGGGWPSALIAGLLAGLVLGWAGRGMVSAKDRFAYDATRSSSYGPGDAIRDQGHSPWLLQGPEGKAPPTARVGSPGSPGSAKAEHPLLKDKKVAPPAPKAPATASLPKGAFPLPGALSPVDPGSMTVKPALDLHSAEARVRTIAASEGGRIVTLHDARNGSETIARSMVISVSPEKAPALADRIRKELGTTAMVEPPVSSPDSSSPELRTEQNVLEQLKQRAHQASLDFYPDAPALKSLEAQYADQLKKVDQLRRSLKMPATVTVVLVGSAH